MSARLRHVHAASSRLIYQSWQHKMVEAGQGHMVYDWQYMPAEVREAWEDAVSAHLQWRNENLIKELAGRLSVDANVRCDRPHA